MGYIKYYIKPFCFAILIFLLIFGLFKYSMTPNGYKIQSWTVVNDLENAIGRNNLGSEFYKVTKKPATIIISSSVDAGHLLSLKESSTKYLYLPQIDNSYFAVYIDGKQIGTLGFKDKRTGHFWYQPVIFELPESFSNIRLEISGIYEIGIDFGAYIIDSSQLPKYNILLFLTNSLLHITIGLALTIAIILYAISKNLVPEKKRAYLYLGLGSFLGSIWMFD
ncbi:MAG TPA: GGDEF domain-containing protein, partial [Fervidobacterium sp.]|nr:GGDEF domain-containing protein [Fervidobacterium sp.]